MTTIGPAERPPDTEQLIKSLGNQLKESIEREVSGESDTDKVYQYANARRNSLMFRGFQLLGRVLGADGIADYQNVGGGLNGANGTDGSSYSYTNNIFRGNGRKFIAVIGQRAPNVTAQPDDPDSDKGEKAARNANKLNSILDSWWSVDERNMEAAETVWVTGPAFIYTPWNADGDLYGYREEPVYEQSPVPIGEATWQCIQCGANQPPGPDGNCPQCGTPMGQESQMPPESLDHPRISGTKKYANGQVECHITDVLHVTTPFFTRDLKTCPWLKFEKEELKGVLLKAFPRLRSKVNSEGDWSDTGSSAIGRQARDSVMSPTGQSSRKSASRWNFTRIWLQTKQYEVFQSEPVRQQLYENFPEGLKISMVNGEIVDLEDERLNHVWSVIKPEAGEGINIDPVGQDLISAQLMENQALNIGMETLERGISMILADPRVWNFEQMRKRSSKPAEFIPALPAIGDSLAESFFATPAARFSDQQMPFIAAQKQSATENVGITPSIFGNASASTAREAEINKNAAMMQLGITWTYFRKGWEAAKYNGARQLAKHGPAVVQEGKLVVEMSELLEANWHFVADEAIPTSWGQQRDLLMFFMEKPPAVLEAWGYNAPKNIAKSQSLLGMSGWYTPNLDDIEKFKDTIAELLQGKPIQTPQPDGSMDVQPSVPVDDFEDNHPLAAQYTQEWAQSEPGRMARKENPDGYANAIAWGRGHLKLANPPAPPPPPNEPKLSISAKLEELIAMNPEVAQQLLKEFNVNANLAAMGIAGQRPSPRPQPALPGQPQPNMPGPVQPQGGPPAATVQ